MRNILALHVLKETEAQTPFSESDETFLILTAYNERVQMKDLDLAKESLRNSNNALVIVKNGQVLYESSASGIQSLLAALDKIGEEMEGSALADRIVGEAAAQLCAYSRVREVYAVVLSSCGRDVLRRSGIHCEYENIVPHILNMKKTDLCPFEKIAAGSVTPQEAYERLRKRLPSSPS